MSDRFVVLTAITKALSPLPVFIFLNLRIHPDTVTLVSLLFILLGSAGFIAGMPVIAVLSYFLFALFDSVDGDMARCIGPTTYGSVLDSFGADLFYAIAPFSIGYYLFSIDISLFSTNPSFLLLIGAFTSASFMLYRIMNAKVYKFLSTQQEKPADYTAIAKEKMTPGLLKKFVGLYRHVLIRGNFFSEPGMLLWFSVFVVLKQEMLLGVYMILLLVYNIGYLIPNFIGTYLFFKSLRHQRR
jgi:phosphatidylglycerophosphate synthase